MDAGSVSRQTVGFKFPTDETPNQADEAICCLWHFVLCFSFGYSVYGKQFCEDSPRRYTTFWDLEKRQNSEEAITQTPSCSYVSPPDSTYEPSNLVPAIFPFHLSLEGSDEGRSAVTESMEFLASGDQEGVDWEMSDDNNPPEFDEAFVFNVLQSYLDAGIASAAGTHAGTLSQEQEEQELFETYFLDMHNAN
jgi:hypothetical protein